MEKNVLISLICFCFLFILGFLEIRRSNSRNLFLRLLSCLMLSLGMALLLLQFNLKESRINVVLLVGSNVPKDSLDRSREKLRSTCPSKTCSFTEIHSNSRTDEDFSDLAVAGNTQVHYLGSGTDSINLPQSKHYKFVFHGIPEVGFEYVSWPRNVLAGDSIPVCGYFHADGSSPVIISVSVDDGGLDSTTTRGSYFDLKTQMPTEGAHLITIKLKTGARSYEEYLPVVVGPALKPSVHILAQAPDADLNFLKIYLLSKGWPVSMWAKMAQQASYRSYPDAGHKTPSDLDMIPKDVQVLVAQEGAIASLPAVVKRDLSNRIKNGKMGLIELIDSAASSLKAIPEEIRLVNRRTIRGVTYSLSESEQQPLLTDAKGPVATRQRTGKGRVVFLGGTPLFQLLLSGNKKEYSRRWLKTIFGVLPDSTPENHFQVSPFPSVDRKTWIIPSEEGSKSNTFLVGNDTVQASCPGSKVVIWPADSGWLKLSVPGTLKVQEVFVSGPGHWRVVTARHLTREDEEFAMHRGTTEKRNIFQKRSLSPVWPAILIILSLTFLYAERKYLLS